MPSTTRVATIEAEEPQDASRRTASAQRAAEKVCQSITDVLVAEWDEGEFALVAPIYFENLAAEMVDAADAWASQFPANFHAAERSEWSLALIDQMVLICPKETEIFTSVLSLD